MMDTHFWFNGWEPLIRIVLVGIISYAALLVLIRAAGKRSLSKMNAHDFIITMALGSILAKIILSNEVSISESLTASTLLILLQYLMTWCSSQIKWIHRLANSQPCVLFHDDHYNRHAMRKEHINMHDIQEALHEKGLSDMTGVKAVILGSNGKLNVLLK